MDNQQNVISPYTKSAEPTPSSAPANVPTSTSPIKASHAHRFIFGYLVLLVLVATIGGVYEWQHKKVVTLSAQVSNLQKQQTAANTQIANLKATNGDSAKTTSPLPTGAISNSSGTSSYTYPGKYFTLAYLSSWTVSAQNAPPAAAQPGILPTVVTITPPNAVESEAASITVYKSTSLSNALKYAFVGNGATVENNQSLTVNGYNVQYQQNVVTGANSTTDDSYAITNNSYTVVLSFRVQQTVTQPVEGLTTFNATSLLPEFNAIVTSTKF